MTISIPSSSVELSVRAEILGDPSVFSPSFEEGVLDFPDTD
jgi:hypothetical protein